MPKVLLRQIVDQTDRILLPIVSSSRLLSFLYYLTFNARFKREHRSVLSGRLAYWQGLGTARHSSPLLRRNIHRLEKGLVMRPRQPVFAEEYIEETVAEFTSLRAAGGLDPSENKWAIDVLVKYFMVVTETAAIVRARAQFSALGAVNCDGEDLASVPRSRLKGVESQVSYEDFIALCRQRRSVRWFEQRHVPRDLITQALDAAAQAPSACNRQPFLFRYFERPDDARRIAAIAMGTAGFAGNIPALVVLLGDLGCYPEERDRHVPYIDASLAAMQFMLALETLGLASCPINWPDIEHREREMAKALELPWHLRPVMLIALGYPDPQGGVPFSAKKPSESLLRTSNDYTP